MTTYNWYFSQSGNDITGNGSINYPWKSLAKAQTQINLVNTNDIANLFFKRGDIWTANTAVAAKISCHGLFISATNPIVDIDAYGSGNKPIFDGLVSNFVTTPIHNSTTGPLFYNRFFEFKRNSCSMSNVEIKRVYGHAVFLNPSDYFTMDSCNIHDFGAGGISTSTSTGGSNITVTNNIFHTGQELYRYAKRSGWEAAIQLTSQNHLCENNIIRYNIVYDIYGEGIQCPNSLCEYNIVGDTGSIALNTSNHGWDAKTTTVRYNIVTMSDWGSSVYDTLNGSSAIGIRIFDEHPGGNNSGADIQVYGNIVINRKYGIQIGSPTDPDNPYGLVKVYNNTIIDCESNWVFAQPEEFSNVYIYNNSSIHYDRIGAHTKNWDISGGYGNWTFDNNHFYPIDGSNSVLAIFDLNRITGDPKLPGETAIDWDGQSGPTYYKDIKFSDIIPQAGSALIGSGKTLGVGFDNAFLTKGTDFSTLPDDPKFIMASQPIYGNWDIGAIVPSDGIDPCEGVVCENVCAGYDLWSQICNPATGTCVPDQLLESNSVTCGYDPCEGVVCENVCAGYDLWSQICNPATGTCVPYQLVEENSVTCGHDPCEGVVCENICVGSDLWSQTCNPATGTCVPNQLIETNSSMCITNLCEGVVCPNICVGDDLWSQTCDPATGNCVADQLIQQDSINCKIPDQVPSDESTINTYLILGGFGLMGLAMMILNKKTR